MKLRFLIFLLLHLSVCVPLRSIEGPHYNVYIDPSFSTNETRLIMAALDEWESTTEGAVNFSIIKASQSGNSDTPTISFYPSTQSQMHKDYTPTSIGRTNYRGSDNEIIIATDLGITDFYKVSLHEIGHAIGLNHQDKNTVMNGNVDNASLHLTCIDIKTFCDVWNCDSQSMSPCQK